MRFWTWVCLSNQVPVRHTLTNELNLEAVFGARMDRLHDRKRGLHFSNREPRMVIFRHRFGAPRNSTPGTAKAARKLRHLPNYSEGTQPTPSPPSRGTPLAFLRENRSSGRPDADHHAEEGIDEKRREGNALSGTLLIQRWLCPNQTGLAAGWTIRGTRSRCRAGRISFTVA